MEKARYDVFLSHATPDKPEVEKLARILDDRGISLWLDKWNLVAGEPWQEAIEDALDQCASCAVCIGPGKIGPWQNEEMRVAIQDRVDKGSRRFRVFAVFLPGATSKGRRLPSFLRRSTWIEFKDTLEDEQVLHELLSGIRGVAPGRGPGQALTEDYPYPGLRSFGVEDAKYFFGRETLIQPLLEKWNPSGSERRFLAIVGASGSGKSSLAQAGLLDALRCGALPGSESWPVALCRTRTQPLEDLALALSKVFPFGDSLPAVEKAVADLAQRLETDPGTLNRTVRIALSQSPSDQRLMVLADQFEEIFTLCPDEGQRRAFIANLLDAAMAPEGRTAVVITLRGDFYEHCDKYPGLPKALSEHQHFLEPMTEEELRRAIEKPARNAGVTLEGGLTDLLLNEVRDQPGILPLLQYALSQIWDFEQGQRLTARAYREIGKVQGALQQFAERVYTEFTEEEKEVCRQVFLRLIRVDDQRRATRRRLAVDELIPPSTAAGADQTTRKVLASLTDARLLTTEADEAEGDEKRPMVELAHEAIIAGWKRLQAWIEQDRESLRTRDRLKEGLTEWLASGRDESILFRGIRLDAAKEWGEKHPAELTPALQEFIEASRDLSQRELAQARALEEEQRLRAEAEQQRAEEEQRRADAERQKAEAETSRADTERRRAEEQLRARQRLKKWTISFASTAVVAAVAFGIALYQYNDLENRRRIAIATELGKQSQFVSQKDPSLALLLSIEAVRRAEKAGQPHLPDAEESLRRALSVFRGNPLPTGRVRAVSLSSDHQWLAVAGTNSTISLWHLTDGGPVKAASVEQLGSSFHLKQIAVSPRGQWVLVSFEGKPSLLFSVELQTGRTLSRHELPGEDWRSNPFSPGGRWLLTRRAGRLTVRDLTIPSPLKATTLDIDPEVTAFSPDDQWLAVVENDGLQIKDFQIIEMSRIHTGLVFRPISGEEGASHVDEIAFSSDSQWLVAATPVQAWRLRPGQAPDLKVHLEACAWSHPDGPSLLDPSLFSEIMDLVDCQLSHQPDKKTAAQFQQPAAATYDPTAGRFALGFLDGGVGLGNVAPGVAALLKANFQTGPVHFLAFHGGWLVTQGGNDPPRALDVGRGTTLVELEPKALAPVPKAVVVSLDGWRLSLDTPLRRLWGPRGPQPVPGSERTGDLWAFSPNGRWLAAENVDHKPLAWQVRMDGTVSSPTSFSAQYHRPRKLTALAFSPDGRWLATGDEAGESRLWDLQDPPREPRELTNHQQQVTSLAFSYERHLIATAGYEGAVWLRELNGNPATHDLPEAPAASGGEPITALAFLPDGRLAIGDFARHLRLWAFGEHEVELDAGQTRIFNLTSSPQGDRLASSKAIWSVGRGDLQPRPVFLPKHGDDPKDLAFTQDGHGLWTLYDDRLLRWELRTDKLLATACRAVGRNLTEKEWRTYIPSEPYHERETCPELPKAFD